MEKHLEKEICSYCLGTGKLYIKSPSYTGIKIEKCLGCDGTGIRTRLTKQFKEDLR